MLQRQIPKARPRCTVRYHRRPGYMNYLADLCFERHSRKSCSLGQPRVASFNREFQDGSEERFIYTCYAAAFGPRRTATSCIANAVPSFASRSIPLVSTISRESRSGTRSSSYSRCHITTLPNRACRGFVHSHDCGRRLAPGAWCDICNGTPFPNCSHRQTFRAITWRSGLVYAEIRNGTVRRYGLAIKSAGFSCKLGETMNWSR
jgi:hypothetical protein